MSNRHSLSDLDVGEDDDAPALSATPTPSHHSPQLHRSSSQSSARWTATDTPSHHHAGTSYFPISHRPVSPTVRQQRPNVARSMSGGSVHRGTRSTSLSSRRGFPDEAVSEEEEDNEDDDDDEEGGRKRSRGKATATEQGVLDDDDEDGDSEKDEDPITLKERQSLINVEHPFGLPIWKPALYKKSRSVTRYADEALHSVPSAQAERHLLPGNLFWVVFFGWWLALSCFTVSALLYVVPQGGKRYSSLVFGLGWYIAWPFGKYVEGDVDEDNVFAEDEECPRDPDVAEPSAPSGGVPLSKHSTITPRTAQQHSQTVSWTPVSFPNETTSLIRPTSQLPSKSYGATIPLCNSSIGAGKERHHPVDFLGKAFFWLFLVTIITPLLVVACVACWGLVITIPMAKLNWALITYLFERPTSIRFCAAPPAVVFASPSTEGETNEDGTPVPMQPPQFSVKHPRLSEGQQAPSSGSPTSKVLLCTYRAVGWKYYKYTVGGVNIMFINLLPLVIFAIIDGFFLLDLVEEREKAGKHVPAILHIIASRALIFFMSLTSVIPLSYFIGMAVASISAQSSIGMGAVINATFGSVIEIILYGIMLTEGKGHLVEGSIVGSLLAGTLLMPGLSMCSGALKKKEQKFNAKSAGVTSMMLIMAFIGTLTPTLFYQTYGNFQLVCSGCPDPQYENLRAPWKCDHCYYEHPDPVDDPFYQSTVKDLMFFCAAILLFSYLIGLWFSLRTHASQIWQNPQQLLHALDLPGPPGPRLSIYNRSAPTGPSNVTPGHRGFNPKPSSVTNTGGATPPGSQTPVPRMTADATIPRPQQAAGSSQVQPVSPTATRRISYAPTPTVHPHGHQQPGYTPLLESVDHAIKNTGISPMHLPESMTTDDFTRAVAVATVSALRHQQNHGQSPARARTSGLGGDIETEGGHGGHEAPSWSRTISAAVLLGCTALYAIIAEILVDVVDVVLEGSGIDEKFLGITLFALVPNTTEFMNAISFALHGNIALSMEIGSAYALQVCLLQIPAMVAFSAWYAPAKMGNVAYSFTLIFPRWDVIVIILSVFLMTYTYIEAKSNYHRGSILVLSYLVLVAGFFFAPHQDVDVEQGRLAVDWQTSTLQSSVPLLQSLKLCISLLWSR